MPDNPPVQRRLAAILAADVAGYSRLMGADEEGTLRRLKSLRASLIDRTIAEHRGRIVKTTGDGMLVEFASVVDAMHCAIAWQGGMSGRNAAGPADTRIEWRIGVNLGDIIIDDGDIHGDGVNIAARLEAMAESGGICISHAVLTQTRGKLDFPVEDLGEQALKNIAQPVHVFRVLPDKQPMPEPAALPLPDKPSIAVLPFQNMSGDPEQEYFADGMVEEIITALSRIRWLFVIARNSTFTYKGHAIDVKRVGRELGVRYVLEGSVRKSGNRVRITAQLIEAETGAHLWADRFDGSLADVFDLQDQVAISVAGVIEPTLQAAEIRRSANRPTKDLTAYDLYLRALLRFASVSREGVQEALQLIEQAIARDAEYGPALALSGMCHFQLHLNGWANDPVGAREQGIDRARKALSAAIDDPFVLASAAVSLGYFGDDIQATMAMMDRALAANPSFAYGWFWSAVLRLLAGQPDLTIEHMQNSLRLNPRDRFGTPLTPIGGAYFFKREFEKAVTTLRTAIQERPDYVMSYRFLAAACAHMGRLDAARQAADQIRAITPIVVPPAVPFRNPEDRELLLSGLRLAIGEAG